MRSQDIRGVQIILSKYCIQRKYICGQTETGMDYKPHGLCSNELLPHYFHRSRMRGSPVARNPMSHTFRNVSKTPIDSYLSKSHGLLFWICVYIFLSTTNSLSHWSSPRTPKLIYTLVYAHRGLPIYRNPPYQ